METIIYQGQEIKVTLVNRQDGCLSITAPKEGSWLEHEGTEEIFRDEQGQYYLRRKLRFWDYDSDTERPASGCPHVHRISVKTAALWALMRCDVRTNDLRRDVKAGWEHRGTCLGTETNVLVDRFLQQTPYEFTAGDVIIVICRPVLSRRLRATAWRIWSPTCASSALACSSSSTRALWRMAAAR